MLKNLQPLLHHPGSALSVLSLALGFVGCASESQPAATAPAKPVVLLITGTTIPASFYDSMSGNLERDGFRPVVFQPPDRLTDPLAVGAERIGAAVKNTLDETGAERLHILAECNGGVAARYYLEKLGGDRYVDRFITFVSAHHGTAWAESPLANAMGSARADMLPGSAFLSELNGTPTPIDSTMVSIYVCSDEIMDPYTTSKLPHADLNIEICDAGLDQRSKDRPPFESGDTLGDIAVRAYPIHLSGFWDEPFYRLFLSSLQDPPETIRGFSELNLSFD